MEGSTRSSHKRSTFVVAEEGTRPCLIIEIVSPKSRKGDRVTKVRDDARLAELEAQLRALQERRK